MIGSRGVYNETPPTLTDGQVGEMQLNEEGSLLVAVSSGNVGDVPLGQAAESSSLPVVLATDQTPVPVGAKHVKIAVTPTLDTSIMASGDVIATAILTFADAVRANGGTGRIKKMLVIDKDVQSIAGELWLFDTAVTPAAANAAHSISDANAAHCIGVIPFGTYYASALNSVAVSSLDLAFVADAADTDIFGILVTRGTPTYTASGLIIQLVIAQD